MSKEYKKVLSIAGSDSGGGAGIQADLKTFAACKVYGTTVITSITSQNTLGVSNIHPIPVDHVISQIRAVLDDIGTDTIKIGMLYSSDIILAVANTLKDYSFSALVIDPVMISTSGSKLLDDTAIDSLKKHLLPLAAVITPNIPEAEVLLSRSLKSEDDYLQAAKDLSNMFNTSILLKAGHAAGDVLTDLFYNQKTQQTSFLSHSKIDTQNTHGTGCSLSSSIASFLAQGQELKEAIYSAKNYLINSLIAGKDYKIGKGHGPIHHLHSFWD